jgi:hypothetical protein
MGKPFQKSGDEDENLFTVMSGLLKPASSFRKGLQKPTSQSTSGFLKPASVHTAKSVSWNIHSGMAFGKALHN